MPPDCSGAACCKDSLHQVGPGGHYRSSRRTDRLVGAPHPCGLRLLVAGARTEGQRYGEVLSFQQWRIGCLRGFNFCVWEALRCRREGISPLLAHSFN